MDVPTRVSDILAKKKRALCKIDVGASFKACAQRMYENNVGSVLVMDPSNALAGIITWHDILKAVAEWPDALSTLRASEIMAGNVVTTTEDTAFEEVEGQMLARRIRHMPVVRGKEVVGLISRIDVLQNHLEKANVLSDDLVAYIMGNYPRSSGKPQRA
jgi:signal-transduction protein with cAMP-binding, CBS, and nucleotidyltransferase domain